MKILITRAMDFIGTTLIEELQNKNEIKELAILIGEVLHREVNIQYAQKKL